eukprot:3431246-Karenia_brevis.AAC.1
MRVDDFFYERSNGNDDYFHYDHAERHVREVPHGPLSAASPTRLMFTFEFMNAVAANVQMGATYKGIVLDSERPDVELRLPR